MAAMFSKGGDQEPAEQRMHGVAETVIGHTVKVEGTFTSQDNMLIEGEVVGTITTSKDVTIGKEANIKANISAANVTVAGEVHGNIATSGTTKLAASSRVYGDISTQVISIDTGAIMQGQCVTGEKKNDTGSKTGGTKK
ncbi:MAG: polymer-forming cytoskeletal protein [Candidatus Kerfeldbacteria bacterium]|nr:polymer-forming cytoskeletal protein [Candidatus Kerfeldbacteria bacterium]